MVSFTPCPLYPSGWSAVPTEHEASCTPEQGCTELWPLSEIEGSLALPTRSLLPIPAALCRLTRSSEQAVVLNCITA